MKRWSLIIGFILLILPVSAQSAFELIETKEGKIVIIPRRAKFKFNFTIPEITYTSYTPSGTKVIYLKLPDFSMDNQGITATQRPMDMNILSEAYRPFFNVYAPMLRRVSPMAFDFRETSITPIADNSAFFVIGEQHTWPGMGGLTTINPGIIWNSGDFTLSGDAFAGRFYTPFNWSPGYMAGTSLHARYQFSDRFAVMGWGQYAHYFGKEKDNPHMLVNPFFYRTSVGGAAEVMLNENFGVGVGVDFRHNPRSGRMEPQYMFAPVFRTKNIQIRMW